MKNANGLPWLWWVFPLVVIDQLSKWWAELVLSQGMIAVFPGFNLRLAYNRGAAFSLLADAGGWQRGFFIVLTVAICGYLIYWARQAEAARIRLGLGIALVFSGAVGNLIDRVWRGAVVDFLDVYYAQYHWPTFNVADSAITVGVTLLIIDALFSKPEKSGLANGL
jgi:signal peptidase II